MKRRITSWGIFLAVVVAVAVLAGPTALGGPASYVIVDGPSMEPTYHDGDLVIAYERDRYRAGDVIVYDAPIDTQFNVIHRITEETEGGYITQGDNRDEVDGWIAPDDQIFGAALFHIPRGGTIISFLRQPAAILGLLAGWLTLTYFDRRRPEDDESDENSALEEPNSSPAGPEEPTAGALGSERDTSTRRQAVSLLAIAALVGGTAGVFVANAAMLKVDAGVLQAFSLDVDIEIPESTSHVVTVEARFFDSGGGEEIGRSPVVFEPVEVDAGQSYAISWNGPGKGGNSSVVDCDSDEIVFPGTPPGNENSGVGTFSPTADATHVLCVVTAPGNVPDNIDFAIVDGDDVTEIWLTEVVSTDGAACDDGDEPAPCIDAPSDDTAGAPEHDGDPSRGETPDEDSDGDPYGDADGGDADASDDDGARELDGDERGDVDEGMPPAKVDPGRGPVADDSAATEDEPTDHAPSDSQDTSGGSSDGDGGPDQVEDGEPL